MSKPISNLLEVAVGTHNGLAPDEDWTSAVDKVVRSLLAKREDTSLPARLLVLLATADWCHPQRPLSEILRKVLCHELQCARVPLIGGSMPHIFVSEPRPEGPVFHCLEHGFVVIALFSHDLWASVERVEHPHHLTVPDRNAQIKSMAHRLLASRNSRLSLGTSAVADLFAILPGPFIGSNGERCFLDLEFHQEILDAFEDAFPLFGGSAADELARPTKGFQFVNDDCLGSALAVALLEHDFKTDAVMSHGFMPIRGLQVSVDELATPGTMPDYVVTRLDGQPAAERLKELMTQVQFSSPRPTLGLGGGPNAHVVVPLETPERWTGAVRFNRRVHRGYRLTVLNASNEELEERARNTFEVALRRAGALRAAVRVIFSFASIGRFLKFEHEKPHSWWLAMQALSSELAHDLPVVCALCAGEYGQDERRRTRGDNFSIWIACLTGEANGRALNRLLQAALLRSADELLQLTSSDDVKRAAVRVPINAGAAGGQLCICDFPPGLNKILGGHYGHAESDPASGQDFSAVIEHTWRDLADPQTVYVLSEQMRSWSLQIGDPPPAAKSVKPDPTVNILAIVCANRIAVFVPDSRDPNFHCDLDLVDRGNLRAQFIMPLLGAQGRVLATLQIGFPLGYLMDREKMGLWLGFGQKVAAALERAFEYEEREATQKINDIGSHIMQRPAPAEPLPEKEVEEFLGALQELVGADYVHMRIRATDLDGNVRYRLIAPDGPIARLHRENRRFLGENDGTIRHALEHGQIFTSTKDEAYRFYQDLTFPADPSVGSVGDWEMEAQEFKTVGNVLLGTREKHLGCLVLHSKHDYFFTERRRRLIIHAIPRIEALVAKREADYLESQRKLREEALVAVGFLGVKTVHDLMRPLANIRLLTEVLLRRREVDEAQDVREIARQCESMMSLLKSRAQGIYLGFTITSVAVFLEEVKREMTMPWAGQPVFHQTSPDVRIRSNFWLRSAVASLLDNAVETADNCGGRVCVSVERVGNDRNTLRIEIENDGPRLTSEDLDLLKRPGHSSKQAHLGLGVPLAEVGIGTADGTLDLQPRDQGGLLAVIELPLQANS